jgi:hypothetical protein
VTTAAALAALVAGIAAYVIAPPPQPRTPGRVRPPDSVSCPRDRLTAYTGVVTRFSRQPERTVLEIRTDWDTTETVVVTHQGDKGPERWFLIGAKPFQSTDWTTLEAAPGKLRRDVRATAWVCVEG